MTRERPSKNMAGIKMGPYARREYEELTQYELMDNARWAQLRLDQIEKDRICTWKKYASMSQQYTWSQIQQIDPDYYDWARGELEWMISSSKSELNRRDKAASGPPPSAALLEPAPLYSEREREEIAAGNFVADWKEWIHKGWRASARNAHPDAGGSHDAMLRHNRAKELLDRLLEDFEKELK